MKTLLLLFTMALVSLAPTTANAVPVKVGEHYQFIEANYVEYAHDYTMLGVDWYYPGIVVEHWMAYLYSHAWGVRQLVLEMWDDETFETWEEPQTPENYDFTSDDPIYWDNVYGDGGGEEQAIAQPVAEEF